MKNLDSKRGKNPVRFSAIRLWRTVFLMLACTMVIGCRQAKAPNLSVEITATKDNSIYAAARVNSTSNGKGDYLIAGMVRTPGFIRRALLYFDIPKSLIELGSAVVVDSVILSTWTSKDDCHMHSEGKYFYLFTVPETWGEGCSDGSDHTGVGAPAEAGDATWNNRYVRLPYPVDSVGIPWTTPGVLNPTPSQAVAHILMPSVTEVDVNIRWRSTAMNQDIRKWIVDPCSNNGFLIVGGEESPKDTLGAVSFYSKDNVDVSKRPTLIIHYHVNTHATAAEKTVASCCEPVAVVSKKEEEDF
jgi:hypothetical protein